VGARVGLGSMGMDWQQHDDDDDLIRIRALLPLVGKPSRSTLYEWTARGTFPGPVRLGPRAVAWRKGDVRQWQRSRPAARRNGGRK
jgi:prophage regulatory protein